MANYNELIARVRSPYALTERDAQEIADALEARGKRVAELEAALEPFAVKDTEVTPERRYYDMLVKHEDRVRARAALKGERG